MDEKEPAPHIDVTLLAIILIMALAVGAALLSYLSSSYQSVMEWFQSPAIVTLFLVFKIVIVTLDIALGAWLGVTLVKFIRLRRMVLAAELVHTPVGAPAIPPQRQIQENWASIRELLNSSNASDWNIALLRADALFDDLLLHLGYVGEGFADRLKLVSPASLPSIDAIWSAHRLRNMIAHDPVQSHTKETIAYALKSYEQGFRELKLLAPDSSTQTDPVQNNILNGADADKRQTTRTDPPPDLPV